LLKKITIGLSLLVVLIAVALYIVGNNGAASSDHTLTIEDLANKKHYSVGEFNKDYPLDSQKKLSNGNPMSINFITIKIEKEKSLSDMILQNNIVVTTAAPQEQIKEIVSNALFFELYTEKGGKISDMKLYAISSKDGNTEIILNSDKIDLTKCKYLAIGPIVNAGEKKLLFSINP
jgi:hypothetical protein